MNDAAEFRHFRYLLAVAEQRGFRAASEKLNVSQPALSKQAREFQEAFQFRLFQKTRSGRIRLTPTGVAFLSIARDLLRARDDAIDALIAIHRGEIVNFRIGCTPFIDQEMCQTACDLHKELVPSCAVHPSLGSASQLLDKLLHDKIDAALLTLPIRDACLRVELIKQDRMVVCLRKDHSLARKGALSSTDLKGNLTIFRHPEEHPDAHAQLVELLSEIGIEIDGHSHASHPADAQALVKRGYGFALMREGAALDPVLTTRPIIGVNWTVDTAIVFKQNPALKTIPVLVRALKRKIEARQVTEIQRPGPKHNADEPPGHMSLLA